MHGSTELRSAWRKTLAQSLLFMSMIRPMLFLFFQSASLFGFSQGEATSTAIMRPLAFAPGEQLTYRFHYGLLDAAEATIAVKTSKKRRSWTIDAKGKSTGAFSWFFKVDDHYQSHIDPDSGFPIHFQRDVKEGGYELHQDYTFDQVNYQVDAIAFKGKNEPKQSQHHLNAPVHDMVSGIYALRRIAFDALIEGDTVSVPLFMDEEWFQLKAVYAGNKDIKWKGEKWNCALIHPVIQTGRIWKNPDDLAVYITNDSNRIPLLAETRILFGSIKMELTNASGLRSPLGFVPN